MDAAVAAAKAIMAICECTGNKDLEPFLPSVVKAAQSIDCTHACVEKLAGCIFAQNVEAPALAATLPVLTRGLDDKSEEVKRTCCPIVDNMCKAVEDPAAVLPIMPRLEPLVKLTVKKMSNPEGSPEAVLPPTSKRSPCSSRMVHFELVLAGEGTGSEGVASRRMSEGSKASIPSCAAGYRG